MNHKIFFFTGLAILFLITIQPSEAAPEIIIEASNASNVFNPWPNIDDGDTTPDTPRKFTAKLGGSSVNTFRIRNKDKNDRLTITVNQTYPLSSDRDFKVIELPSNTFTLDGKESETFRIRYTPTKSEAFAIISIKSNTGSAGDPKRIYEFAVSGTGHISQVSAFHDPASGANVKIPNAISEPGPSSPHSFGQRRIGGGEVDDTPTEHEFYFRNASSASGPLYINDVKIHGSGGSHFEYVPDFDNPVQPGENGRFKILFNPSSTGIKKASFQFDTNDPDNETYLIGLEGEGTAFPEIRLQGRRIKFGTTLTEIVDGDFIASSADGTRFDETNVGDHRDSLFRIHNDGDDALVISDASITGSGAEGFGFGEDLVGKSIEPGMSEDFQIRFAPVSQKTFKATVSLECNDPSESVFDFAIQGTGEAGNGVVLLPEISVYGSSGRFFNLIEDGTSTPHLNDGTNFGIQDLESETTHTFRINNDGLNALDIVSHDIIGDSENEFSVSNLSPRELDPGSSFLFYVSFSPKTAGEKNVRFKLRSNDPNETEFTFSLTGAGMATIMDPPNMEISGPLLVQIPPGDLDPNPRKGTDFGTHIAGSIFPEVRTFRIRNTSTSSDLILSKGILIGTSVGSDNGFFLDEMPDTIAPGETAFFNIALDPRKESGDKSAHVQITSNDPGTPIYSFKIVGTVESLDSPGTITRVTRNTESGGGWGDTLIFDVDSYEGIIFKIVSSTSMQSDTWEDIPDANGLSGGTIYLENFLSQEGAMNKRFFRLEQE